MCCTAIQETRITTETCAGEMCITDGKHAFLVIYVRGKHASLGICVRETRILRNTYNYDSGPTCTRSYTGLVWRSQTLKKTARANRALFKGLVTLAFICCASTTIVVEPIKSQDFT